MALTVTSQAPTGQEYQASLEAFANNPVNGRYPPTIYIGLGGSGSKALLHLRRLVLERFGAVDALQAVAYLSIDTDTQSDVPPPTEKKADLFADVLKFKKTERINLKPNFASLIGQNLHRNPHIRDWWDERYRVPEGLNVEDGAGQIRPLARLTVFSNREEIVGRLQDAWRQVTSNEVNAQRVNTQDGVRVVIVAGLGGGTGAGTFLDIAALVRGTWESAKIDGYLVLPGVFRGAESKWDKLAANGHACLTEVNHHFESPYEVRWTAGQPRASQAAGLFRRYMVFSGTNLAGKTLSNSDECFRAIGEALFLDYSGGALSAWIRGVQVNRQQYLTSEVSYAYRVMHPDGHHEDAHGEHWYTSFSSFGISKLVFPSWRLLNWAKYDLAAQIVAILDPSATGGARAVTPQKIRRFMYDLGFFQGELEVDGRKQSYRQVSDVLFRLRGVDSRTTSVPQHIERLGAALVDDAEGMYDNKRTRADCDEHLRKAELLIGDPSTPGEEGEWVREIRRNRATFMQDLDAAIDRRVEEYQRQRGMGPSGVAYLIESALDLLRRSGEQEKYGDWFKRRKAEDEKTRDLERKNWSARVTNAEGAGKGLLSTRENHRAAVEKAKESFQQYLRAKISLVLADEAERMLDAIRARLEVERDRLNRIRDALTGLQTQLWSYRDFYAKAQPSNLIEELPGAHLADDLLAEYLGKSRDDRLLAIFERGRNQLGADTLRSLEARLNGERDKVCDGITNLAFHALRGENGWTTAFSEEGEDPKPGFIERYSILSKLEETVKDRRTRDEMVERLFTAGMPWVSFHPEALNLVPWTPARDAFVGFNDAGRGQLGNDLRQSFAQARSGGFSPQHVVTPDPSEIILYTEAVAFPAFFIGELHGPMGTAAKYHELVYGSAAFNPVHIHQDFQDFRPLMPMQQSEVDANKGAWKMFIRALIFGVIRTRRARVWDPVRVIYEFRERDAHGNESRQSLGAEAFVVAGLRDDRAGWRQRIADAVSREEQRFRGLGGTWMHLALLADYYFHAVFPVRRDQQQAIAGFAPPQATMASVVSNELADQWRALARQDARAVSYDELAATLDAWSAPIALEPGELVPMTNDVPLASRVITWGSEHRFLVNDVRGVIRTWEAEGVIPAQRGEEGPATRYPRIGVRWSAFEGASREGVRTYRLRKVGEAQVVRGLKAADVVERVKAEPASRWEVFGVGMADWRPPESVVAISKLLESTGAAPAAAPPNGTGSGSPSSTPVPEVLPPSAPRADAACACGAALKAGARFCPECGVAVTQKPTCPKCASDLVPGAKFCSGCGHSLTLRTCTACDAKLPEGARFCGECGARC